MPLIWNNNEYKLVADDEKWDQLEFVVARKLHVQYLPKHAISIEFIRSEFKIYGALEKIEIFRVVYNNTQFAHVTFKENQTAYLALLDCKQGHKKEKLDFIRPADAQLQPDNPIDPKMSPFCNLPDDCLLNIFDKCDFHTLAKMSIVCTKMNALLRIRVFAKIPKFNLIASSETDVIDGLSTVSRLVQCMNPASLHLKLYRSLQGSVDWPSISVDMDSPKSEISAEMSFFKIEWLGALHEIERRIRSIHIHCSVYDAASFSQATTTVSFPFVTDLSISGYDISCVLPELSTVIGLSTKLEVITFRGGTINWDDIVKYCEQAKLLRRISFENCCFTTDINKNHLISLASELKNEGDRSPLTLSFNRIQTRDFSMKLCVCYNCDVSSRHYSADLCSFTYTSKSSMYNDIQEALKVEDVKKYVYIKINEGEFPS